MVMYTIAGSSRAHGLCSASSSMTSRPAAAHVRVTRSPVHNCWRKSARRGITHAAAASHVPGTLTDNVLQQQFDSVEEGIAAVARGEFVLVLDDQDRENEGDLIIAADKATPEQIAYMVEYTSGVICVAISPSDSKRLNLPLMVSSEENEESMYTAFTVTTDVREGITTGISAADRCKTIQAIADPETEASQLRKPGHIFPLIAREGGVLSRPGHTEAALDLARLAGCSPAGVLCEVVDKSTGEMARTEQLLAMAKAHSIKCITIEDLIRYRLEKEAGS